MPQTMWPKLSTTLVHPMQPSRLLVLWLNIHYKLEIELEFQTNAAAYAELLQTLSDYQREQVEQVRFFETRRDFDLGI